jgi:hypothetical protein
MAQPHGQREFRTGRDTEHRGSADRQPDGQAGRSPLPDVCDEEPLVGREPVRVEGERGRVTAR